MDLSVAEGLQSLRIIAERFTDCLPKKMSVLEIGVKEKAPFNILGLREALLWRTEELLRSACNAIEQRNISTTALLARAMLENTALLHKLKEIFDQRDTLGVQELNAILMQMMFGTREWDDGPQAISILTHIDKLDRTVPNARYMYNILSELAHPNWMGVCGTYSHIDKQKLEAYFGPTDEKVDRLLKQHIGAMLASLACFEDWYNEISEGMPGYLQKLEPL